MNRKSFLKKVTIGASAVAITPAILAEAEPTGIIMAPPDLSPAEMQQFVDEWRRTNGTIVYKSDEDEFFKLESRKANQELIRIFEENPGLRNVVYDMTKGVPFREALSKHFEI